MDDLSPSQRIQEGLDPWMEKLMNARDAVGRDRVLLDAILALSSTRAIALWRRVEAGSWAPWLTRGGRGELPTRGWIEAALHGETPSELPGGTCLIGGGKTSRALVLSGLQEEERDLVEALFATRNLCETAPCPEAAQHGPLDYLDELPWLAPEDKEENTGTDQEEFEGGF